VRRNSIKCFGRVPWFSYRQLQMEQNLIWFWIGWCSLRSDSRISCLIRAISSSHVNFHFPNLIFSFFYRIYLLFCLFSSYCAKWQACCVLWEPTNFLSISMFIPNGFESLHFHVAISRIATKNCWFSLDKILWTSNCCAKWLNQSRYTL
jgi:hypothetical protein